MESLLPQGAYAPHVHPRLRKRLARCTLDCGFKTPESPALRGFVAERCPIRGTSLYLVLKSNGPHRSKNFPEKFGFSLKTVPANIVQKLPSQRCPQPFLIAFLNFSHKRPTFAFMGKNGYALGFRRKIAHSGSHAETGAFPSAITAWLCVASEIPFIPPRFYIHTFPGSLWPPIISNSSTSDHLSSCFSTSPTNGPRSLSHVKVGTHSPSPTGSHTAAYTPKQGPSGRGRYHYPRSVPHVHKHPRAGYQNGVLCRFWVLAGCTPKNAESLGTAMRLCASLLRRRRGPAGLRSLLPVCIQLVLVGWKDLTKRSDRVTITRNDRTASRLALVRKPRWAVK